MSDPAPSDLSTPEPSAAAPPTITATAGYVVTGKGFLPDHDVTIRITYTAEDITDYLTYRTDAGGCLCAELPTSSATGELHISATDHRSDPDAACGRLWSNTQTVRARDA